MGRAKRKHRPPTVTTTRVDREPPLDDRAVGAILAVYGDGNGDGSLTIGLRYAVVAGAAIWAIIGLIVVLLV
jgi:hypothetical protein